MSDAVCCLEEWIERNGGYPDLHDKTQRDGWIAVKRGLWDAHLMTLSEADRRMLDDHSHPFLEPADIDAARIMAEPFRAEMAALPFVAGVSINHFQCGDFALTVHLTEAHHWTVYRPRIPSFYRGVTVIALPPQG